jgi:pSer/pThr/pTyr-binding forkhead associated (FHA) protein
MNGWMRLESWIEQLVEEPFVRLFAGRLLPQEVARHLVRALEDGERVGADGVMEVPGRFRITLAPDDLEVLRRHHPDLEAQLATALQTLAQRMNVRLKDPPGVILQSDPGMGPRGVYIVPADRAPSSDGQTHDLALERVQELLTQEPAAETRAYLIINGERTFDLKQAIVRLGRALDNDVILEDRRVSRHHVQLRRRYGRYILQDLGSSGGTSVNGFPVQEIVLRSGDLISLAGLDLIYAEEVPLPREAAGDTQPYASSQPQRLGRPEMRNG